MNLKKVILTILLLVCMFSLNTSCYPIVYGDRDFHMKRGILYRGKETYLLRAFYVPDTAQKGAELKTMVPLLASIAEVGGNSIAMDILKDPDDTNVDIKMIETIKSYADRAKDQYMTVIVRIAPNNKPHKKEPLIGTLRQNFKTMLNIIYWVDGLYSKEWVKSLKKINKNWTIISNENSDLILAKDSNLSRTLTPNLVFTALPEKQMDTIHFILPFSQENLNSVESAFAKITPCSDIDMTTAINILSEEERKEGFIPLFDGKTLNGWWYLGDNHKTFAVNPEGFIEWKEKGGKALMSCNRYDNFVLRLEWIMMEKNGNTGVWVRAPRGSRASKIGFEVQILGDSDKTELTDDTTGAIYKVIPPKVKAMKPEGQWNDLEIICNGPYVKVTLNGQVVQDVNFDDVEELKYRLRKGFIGLTDHGNHCGFRNIRIKPL